jgi:Rrf2 family protein
VLKLSKKADYALIALRHLAQQEGSASSSAADIADEYGISAPLLAKVLQRLARRGLVVSRHGSGGGYVLARNAEEISALEAINAIDGPLSITSCVTSRGECDLTHNCTVREPLRRVNETILRLLATMKISEMRDAGCGSGIVELRGD